jgi:hypothetical protein
MTFRNLYSDFNNGAISLDQIEFFNKLCKYSELVLLNHNFVQFEPLKISCALIAFTRNNFGLTEWDENMKADYGISSDSFEEILNEVKK